MGEFIIVSPESFKFVFLDEVVKNEAALLDSWNSRKKYTSLMKGQNSSVLKSVAENLNLQYRSEYWSVDSVFFNKLDRTHFGDNEFYAEQISVAVEHENNRNGSQGEMNKLGAWNNPLGVLITYRNHGSDQKYLQMYSEILSKSDWSMNAGPQRKIVVVFGDRANNSLVWDFFVYNRKFEKL